MKNFFVCALIYFSFIPTSWSFDFKKLALDLNFGYPMDVYITNPDDTKASYKGFGFNGKILLPLIFTQRSSKGFSANLTLEYKYLSYQNTASGAVSEDALHKGYAGGLNLRFGMLYLSGSYGFMTAEHKSSGSVSGLSEFDYNPINTEIGVLYPYGELMEVGASYSYTTATFSKSETGLAEDSDYKEQMIWLKAIFYFEK